MNPSMPWRRSVAFLAMIGALLVLGLACDSRGGPPTDAKQLDLVSDLFIQRQAARWNNDVASRNGDSFCTKVVGRGFHATQPGRLEDPRGGFLRVNDCGRIFTVDFTSHIDRTGQQVTRNYGPGQYVRRDVFILHVEYTKDGVVEQSSRVFD